MNKLISWLETTGFRLSVIIIGTWLLLKISRPIIKFVVGQIVSSHHYETERDKRLRRDTLSELITASVKIAIIITASVVILTELGVDVAAVLAGAGVIGLVLGFGMQSLIKDWVSGAFIVMENQYRVGDVVEIEGLSGKVIKITNRITVLRSANGNVHYIPNGTITMATNQTMEFGKVSMSLNVAYDSDIDKVKKVIDDVGKAMAKHKDWKDEIIVAPHFTRVSDFGQYALVVGVVGKVKPAQQWSVEGELRRRIKIAFDKNKIVIPVAPAVSQTSNTKS